MNNLKKFQTEAEYSAAILNYPAVSWVVSGDTVHFDKSVPTFGGLTAHYNITDISQPTLLFNGGGSGSGSGSGSGGALPSAMIVDGTEVEVSDKYVFDTVGEHIVNYSFADNEISEHFLDDEGTGRFSTVVKVEISDAITSIGNNAFVSCSSLTSVTIGSGVTSIGNEVFVRCTSLTSIDIPSGITIIGISVFNGCSSLTSIDIPSGVTSIGYMAFLDCSGLTSITVEAVDPPQLASGVFDNTNNCPIYVPSQSVEEYKNSTSTGWYEYASRIQAIQ